jgi:hypothetical protein
MNRMDYHKGNINSMAGVMKTAQQAALLNSPADKFVVKLTDNPGNFAGLEIEILGVSGYSPVLGWVGMVQDENRVDVLKLTNGREIQLAHCPGYINDYFGFTKIKLRLGERNCLKVWQGSRPDARGVHATRVHMFRETEKDIVVNLDNQTNLAKHQEVLLDFDVARSVKNESNGYILTPRITEVVDKFTGISGCISLGGRHVIFATDYKETYSCFTNRAGQFMIRGMKKGIYSLLAYSGKNSIGQPIARVFVENIKVNNGIISELCI